MRASGRMMMVVAIGAAAVTGASAQTGVSMQAAQQDAAIAAPAAGDRDAVSMLAGRLIQQAGDQTTNTGGRLLEGRFAEAVDAARLPCPDTMRAIDRATSVLGSKAAQVALRDLRATLRDCKTGTGGTGTYVSLGLAPVPNFALGGGSDYRP